MLKQYVPHHHDDAPLHEPGEVVIVTLGNYLEAGEGCRSKTRPGIILATSDCQHWIAGLTTKAVAVTSGMPRPEVPHPGEIGLDSGRRSFLWSPRPARVCRLDVRQHLGWIDFDTAELLSQWMRLPPRTFTALLRAAARARRFTSKPR